jgi:protein TonB
MFLPGTADVSSPWQRLHWTLPLALLICVAVFVWFAWSMTRPAQHTPEPQPIDAQLVELPPPAAPRPPAPHKTLTPPKPASTNHEALPVQKPAKPTPPPPRPATTPPRPQGPPPVASHGALAIVKPMPVIPDDLRQEGLSEAATARFHIAADGTATVELVKPTQSPRLNRLLLETLKLWRFFPAMQDGQPVASTTDMVIRVQVK